jgi:hypothetical protein
MLQNKNYSKPAYINDFGSYFRQKDFYEQLALIRTMSSVQDTAASVGKQKSSLMQHDQDTPLSSTGPASLLN